MKTKLLFKSKIILTLLVLSLCFNYGWSQQVIGEFPIMDGGLENQTAGNLSSQGSSANGTASTTWSISTTGGTTDEKILDTPVDARSGNFSAQAQLNNDKNNARLQAPSTVSPNAMIVDTEYTIQFFYKSPEVLPDANLKPGIYLNNTDGGKTTDKQDVDTFVADTWLKAYGTVTTGSDFNDSNWAVVRIGGDEGVDKPLIHFDDFVVYAGAYDDTAPDAPTSGNYVNNSGTGTISWTSPAGGIDGGGYVVVKYSTDPNADNDPNQNGIYKVGNTTTNGTGSLTGTVVYIGTSTSFTETHVAGTYYKVYTVDKAFNYSDEIKISSDATASTNDVLASKFNTFPNPANDVVQIVSSLEINKVEMYNVLGKKVTTYFNQHNNNVDISSLSKGIYVLKITSGQSTITKKIIKE